MSECSCCGHSTWAHVPVVGCLKCHCDFGSWFPVKQQSAMSEFLMSPEWQFRKADALKRREENREAFRRLLKIWHEKWPEEETFKRLLETA